MFNIASINRIPLEIKQNGRVGINDFHDSWPLLIEVPSKTGFPGYIRPIAHIRQPPDKGILQDMVD